MLKVMVNVFLAIHLPPPKKNFIHIVSPWDYKLLMVQKSGVSPADMVNIPLFTRVYTSQVQDVFHQQYEFLEPSYVLGIFLLFLESNFQSKQEIKSHLGYRLLQTKILGLAYFFWVGRRVVIALTCSALRA